MNRTRYSPRDMELTAGVGQQSVIETPRGTEVFPQRNIQTTTMKRNLLGAFEDAGSEQTIPMEIEGSDFPHPMDTSTPLGSEPSVEEENKTRWNGFLFIWTVLFAIGGFIMFVLYKYFPGHMLMYLTKEFLISGSLTVLCAILASAVLKHIVQNRKSAQRQHFRKSVTPRLRYKKNVSPETPVSRTGITYSSPEVSVQKQERPHQITVKRTFSGDGTDIWSEFIRYFENIAELNEWESDRKRKVLFTVLRGQAETYAYGLLDSERNDWESLITALDARFGHKAMKESYVAEAKLRRKKGTESFRDFGQAIEDLYRRAYPNNREHVQESSKKTFMDNCSDTEDFRLAVKRTCPKTLQDAVTAAMQEECIRMTEDQSYAGKRTYRVNRLSHKVNSGDIGSYASDDVTENKNVMRLCYKCYSSEHLYKNYPHRNLQEVYRNGNSGTGSQQLNEDRPRQ